LRYDIGWPPKVSRLQVAGRRQLVAASSSLHADLSDNVSSRTSFSDRGSPGVILSGCAPLIFSSELTPNSDRSLELSLNQATFILRYLNKDRIMCTAYERTNVKSSIW